MKKFAFSLDRIRTYREARLKEQEARMQALLSERLVLAARQRDLERQETAAMDLIREVSVLRVDELVAEDAFRRYSGLERLRLKAAEREVAGRIEQQRAVLIEAQRQVEMLNRLKEKRLASWRAELDRETENAVSELVIARWQGALEA